MPYRKHFVMLALAWTLAVAASLVWNLRQNTLTARSRAVGTAQALLEKDLLYREWSILHGGVYIPSSTQPDETSASRDEERVAVTPSGQHLTLLNPAIVSRQIFDLQDQQMGIRGAITSLNPLRPKNGPDPWERQALEAFAAGAKEVSGIELIQGEPNFRMMRPLITVPACLRCHEEAGRKPGTVRGGISVSLPMARFAQGRAGLHLSLAHLGLWLIGLTGLSFGFRNLEHHSQQLAQALREKEALLQEIHHRVKNNLQVISSLLKLQSNEIKDPQTLAIFRESQSRIRSMSLIHEKLYASHSLAQVDLADYLRGLTQLLFSTYGTGRSQVSLDLNLAPVFLGIDAAIPLGLIANELITNSLKFAFPDGRQGVIRVELAPLAGGRFRFRVADDGIGLPPGFVVEKAASLGMRLVRVLTRQLGAEGTWETVRVGASFTLEFRDKPVEAKETHGEQQNAAGLLPSLAPGKSRST